MQRRNFLEIAGGSIIALSGCTMSGDTPTESGTPQTSGGTTPQVDTSPAKANCTGETTTPTQDEMSDPSEPNEAIVIESCIPIAGTNVNVGVGGVAKNITGHWLVNCVIKVTGDVGEETFHAQATRSPLAPQQIWEWKVPFGEDADALNDNSPENITIGTGAEYRDWG